MREACHTLSVPVLEYDDRSDEGGWASDKKNKKRSLHHRDESFFATKVALFAQLVAWKRKVNFPIFLIIIIFNSNKYIF